MLNNPAARRLASGVIEPPARLLIRMRVSADAVTLVGTLGVVVVSLTCFVTGRFVLGVVLISVFALSDLIDGTMARLKGTSGPWGNFLDATLDRIADGAIFGSLIAWAALNGQPWVVAAATTALVTGQVTSYAKARAEAVGATANVGIAERAERNMGVLLAVLLTGLGVPYVLPVALWLIAGLGVITIVQRIMVVRSQLKA
jgi:CDP-diacylglycerol--glycerol-3-phosphate 3-phosphatidyltransferase